MENERKNKIEYRKEGDYYITNWIFIFLCRNALLAMINKDNELLSTFNVPKTVGNVVHASSIRSSSVFV